ncbi:MAG: VWA domain-containing protein [Leptospira sp.]|nr:VWA domain-containing protein [Leptospira sp.]
MNLDEIWNKKWEEALKLWSDYVKLSPVTFLEEKKDEEKEGLIGSFAGIRLIDHRILISLKQIRELNLEDYPLEILGHEIGHHVYCPGDLSDQGKLIYIARQALPRMEHLAPTLINIYEDLFINDRLKKRNSLKMEEVYKKIGKNKDPFWNLYMRVYELLWALPTHTLTEDILTDQIQSDANLIKRIIQNFPNQWTRGAFDFVTICFPYFFGEGETGKSDVSHLKPFLDTKDIGKGNIFPTGITEIEIESELFPNREGAGKKQELSPSQYSEICKALGINAKSDEMAYKYYKEKALPYLISFPEMRIPGAKEQILEGNELWDPGSPIENINWIDSVIKSPILIPGYTTVEDIYGEFDSYEIEKRPIDLDLFVDCSGSMPNPINDLSYLTLAGAIISLSALRVGSSVRVTLWSGLNEYTMTEGFTKNEKDILKVLTGYYGGGTCFPLDVLETSYREPKLKKTHVLIISDEGIDTMYTQSYHRDTRELVQTSLTNAGGGGSMVLHLYDEEGNKEIQEMKASGWDIYRIASWDNLIQFSKDFVRKNYERN